MTRKSSHEIVNRRQIVLFFYTKDCKLVEYFALEWINGFSSIIKAPALFVVCFFSFAW